jgi:peptide deformylase
MLRIFTFPDDILKHVAAPVRSIDGTLAAFLDEMARSERPTCGAAAAC